MENSAAPLPTTIPVYLIPGLGADRRAFESLRLPEGFHPVVLEWEEALPKETFEAYAARMAARIDTHKPFALLGHSMGGMIASEITPLVKPVKTILISSSSSAAEVPPYYKWMHALRLPYLVPPPLFKQPNGGMHWILGAKSPEVKALNDTMMREFSPSFFTWAFRHIPTWKRTARPGGLVHLHGTADRMLPFCYVHPDYAIPEGGHLMMLEQAEEVNAIVAKELMGALVN